MSVPRETSTRVPVGTCPICEHASYLHYITTTDFSASKESFDIVQCAACGFRYTNPIPPENNLGSYYQFADYISHTNRSGGLMGFVYRWVRSVALKQKIRLLARFKKGNRLLDVGCGTGFFAAAAQKAGYAVTGIEPDEGARKFAVENNKINALPAEQLQTMDDRFDVITLWHVLEHLYHLQRDVARLTTLLNKEGVLVIAVPNCDSYDANYFKEYWAGYDVPRHLYHFVQADLEKLMGLYGFRLRHIEPMRFDAYYVSMLSRQHMGKGKWAGIFTGGKSNRSARSGRTPWSSQVYIFTR